jgi:hypothetical protein
VKNVQLRINWVGLAGGVTTIVVVIVSLFYPWWQLTVGDNLIKANVSPLNTNFDVLGTSFTMPLIWALNVTSLLTLIVSAIAMLIYALAPAKSYSKQLLDFAYKKPIFMLLSFVIILVALTLLLQVILNFNFPLVGTATSTLPISFIQGTTIAVLISTGFQWPFWLAAVASGLCIAARIYHKKFATAQKAVIAPAATAPSTVTLAQ